MIKIAEFVKFSGRDCQNLAIIATKRDKKILKFRRICQFLPNFAINFLAVKVQVFLWSFTIISLFKKSAKVWTEKSAIFTAVF